MGTGWRSVPRGQASCDGRAVLPAASGTCLGLGTARRGTHAALLPEPRGWGLPAPLAAARLGVTRTQPCRIPGLCCRSRAASARCAGRAGGRGAQGTRARSSSTAQPRHSAGSNPTRSCVGRSEAASAGGLAAGSPPPLPAGTLPGTLQRCPPRPPPSLPAPCPYKGTGTAPGDWPPGTGKGTRRAMATPRHSAVPQAPSPAAQSPPLSSRAGSFPGTFRAVWLLQAHHGHRLPDARDVGTLGTRWWLSRQGWG